VIAAPDPSLEVLLVPDPWSVDVREIRYMGAGRRMRDEPAGRIVAGEAPRKAALYIVTPNHGHVLDVLRARHPEAAVEEHRAPGAELVFTAVRVGAVAAPAGAAHAPSPPPLRLTATSFRTDLAYLAERAVDGDPSTRWESGRPQSGGEWFGVALPARVTVEGLSLDTSGSPNDYPRGLTVSVSDDGVSFQPVARVEPREPRFEVAFDPPRPCRYVRLEQTGSDATAWWSIHEVTVATRP
jgi:hypothetical protein